MTVGFNLCSIEAFLTTTPASSKADSAFVALCMATHASALKLGGSPCCHSLPAISGCSLRLSGCHGFCRETCSGLARAYTRLVENAVLQAQAVGRNSANVLRRHEASKTGGIGFPPVAVGERTVEIEDGEGGVAYRSCRVARGRVSFAYGVTKMGIL